MESNLHLAVGSRLAELRVMRGFTVDSFSKAVDLLPETIDRHEAGEAIPTWRLRRFAGVLRVGLSAFFLDEVEDLRIGRPSAADVPEGLSLIKAFQDIGDAHLRRVLIDIAWHFRSPGAD